MGAWSYEVLANDSALDILDDFIYSTNLQDALLIFLNTEVGTNNDIDEKLVAVAIVDASINGTDESILGCYDGQEEWFRNLSETPLIELLPVALTTLQFIKENDYGWVDEVKPQRERLLSKIESRLQSALHLHEDDFYPQVNPNYR